MRYSVFLLLFLVSAFAQNEPPRSRSEGESSSKQTMIDISPPADDMMHPGSDEDDDVVEMKPYDPHRADKDIEVGDYYLKQKNFKAAIARYRDALEYKAGDAIATMKLASVLEKVKEFSEAAELYAAYVKLHPNGEYADSARSGLERLKAYAPEDKLAIAMDKGEEALRAKDFAGAQASFERALQIDAKASPAQYRLAQSLEGQGKANDALKAYYDYLLRWPGGSFADDANAAMNRLKRKGATLATSAPSQTPQ